MNEKVGLQSQVEEVRRLAESRTVECHCDEVGYYLREGYPRDKGAHVYEDWSHYRAEGGDLCPMCRGTGRIPDPAFSDLLDSEGAAMREIWLRHIKRQGEVRWVISLWWGLWDWSYYRGDRYSRWGSGPLIIYRFDVPHDR